MRKHSRHSAALTRGLAVSESDVKSEKDASVQECDDSGLTILIFFLLLKNDKGFYPFSDGDGIPMLVDAY